jgi:hypothetical protein
MFIYYRTKVEPLQSNHTAILLNDNQSIKRLILSDLQICDSTCGRLPPQISCSNEVKKPANSVFAGFFVFCSCQKCAELLREIVSTWHRISYHTRFYLIVKLLSMPWNKKTVQRASLKE